jgi:hypothetical protein
MSTTTPSALDQLLFDIFVTALEGGIGYWSACQEYSPFVGDSNVENIKGFSALIVDMEEDGLPPYTIDRTAVAKGYGLATSATWRNRLNWSSSKPSVVVGPDTDWDFDAGDADMIIQLGLFGDVVYG